jgi:hypothetical protein
VASLAPIRAGLALALAAYEPEFQVSARMLSNPIPPAIHIFPDETSFHEAMNDGMETWSFIVQGIVGYVASDGAQDRLDSMLQGSGTVKELLEAASAYGAPMQAAGLCCVNGVCVDRVSGYRTFVLDAVGELALGCDWYVRVVTP